MKKLSRRFFGVVVGSVLLAASLVGCGSSPDVAAAFDVPALVGSDINGVTAKLGKPIEDEPPNAQVQKGMAAAGDREWSKSWTHDGHDLLVTYKIAPR